MNVALRLTFSILHDTITRETLRKNGSYSPQFQPLETLRNWVKVNGWPGSFYEMHKIIPLLTDPASYGGNTEDAFDVIVPSLPGFGFSDRPHQSGMNMTRTAELWAHLMTKELGYTQFGTSRSDIGSGVTQHLALAYPELLVGIHLHFLGDRKPLSS